MPQKNGFFKNGERKDLSPKKYGGGYLNLWGAHDLTSLNTVMATNGASVSLMYATDMTGLSNLVASKDGIIWLDHATDLTALDTVTATERGQVSLKDAKGLSDLRTVVASNDGGGPFRAGPFNRVDTGKVVRGAKFAFVDLRGAEVDESKLKMEGNVRKPKSTKSRVFNAIASPFRAIRSFIGGGNQDDTASQASSKASTATASTAAGDDDTSSQVSSKASTASTATAGTSSHGRLQPGFNPGLQPGFNQGLQPGFNQGLQPGFNQGLQPGFNTGLQPGFNTGLQPGFNQGLQPAFNTGLQPGGFQPVQQRQYVLSPFRRGTVVTPSNLLKIVGFFAVLGATFLAFVMMKRAPRDMVVDTQISTETVHKREDN